MRSLLVVSAGLSQPSSSRRLADMLAEATRAKISARGEGAEIDVIEVRDLAFELATAMTDQTAQTPLLARVKQQVADADGLIAVTPVFQGSYSGLFKMFFDTLDPMPSTTYPPSSQRRPVLRVTPSFWTTRSARYLTNCTQTSCQRAYSKPQKT